MHSAPAPPKTPTPPKTEETSVLTSLERDLGLADGTVLRVFKTTRGDYEVIYRV